MIREYGCFYILHINIGNCYLIASYDCNLAQCMYFVTRTAITRFLVLAGLIPQSHQLQAQVTLESLG